MASFFYKDGKATKFESDVCPEGYTDAPNGWTNPEDAPKPKEIIPPKVDEVKKSTKNSMNKSK